MDFPQGSRYPGLPAPLLRCLVIDDLLTRLSGGSALIQGYADDMSSRGGSIPKHSIRTHAVGPFDRRNIAQRGRHVG